MEHIDTIIFDLGGVILNIRYENTVEAFQKLSGKDATHLYTQHGQSALFTQMEKGQISDSEFRDGLRGLLEVDASDEVLDKAWNALLLDMPPERLTFLQQLKQKKQIFLLSNTNRIHKRAFDAQLKTELGIDSFDPFFEKSYYSHQVGDVKPNQSIFKTVIEENNLIPSKTLFIDDTIRHVEGARSLGLQAIHLTAPTTILDLGLL